MTCSAFADTTMKKSLHPLLLTFSSLPCTIYTSHTIFISKNLISTPLPPSSYTYISLSLFHSIWDQKTKLLSIINCSQTDTYIIHMKWCLPEQLLIELVKIHTHLYLQHNICIKQKDIINHTNLSQRHHSPDLYISLTFRISLHPFTSLTTSFIWFIITPLPCHLLVFYALCHQWCPRRILVVNFLVKHCPQKLYIWSQVRK